jgi:hypothetical protein
MLRKQEIRMKEQEKKKKGNLWLTVATFIVNKRKAIEIFCAGNYLQCAVY